MKKIISLLLAGVLMTTLLAGCGSQNGGSSAPESAPDASSASSDTAEAGTADETAGGTLTLYTWAGMFPQELLDQFTEETGIAINYATFDTDETMLAKLQTAGDDAYDLVIADDYIIEPVIAEGLAAKLDTTKLSHYGSLNPLYQKQFFDPNDEYSVPLGAGVQTIVYNPDLVEKEITSYADLWDPSLADSIGVTSNYRVINGMALKVLGESYNTEDIETIEAAGQKLKELAPNIRVIKDDNLQNDLISGEINVAVMYTSQVTHAMMTMPSLKVVFPSEGIGLGVMSQFIPSSAPNPEAAYRFIDFLLNPEIAATYYEFLGYYSVNKDADALISEEYQDFLTLPGSISAEDMEMIQLVSPEAAEEHEKAWTAFKSATE